jgi:hypothetical protein
MVKFGDVNGVNFHVDFGTLGGTDVIARLSDRSL